MPSKNNREKPDSSLKTFSEVLKTNFEMEMPSNPGAKLKGGGEPPFSFQGIDILTNQRPHFGIIL